MSEDINQNFGNTLSGGIQDISALLPLLGTEQCERHAGSALDKGFLYAAAAPLSIFGSLGIVKTAFAALLATMTHPFRGALWLDDAGFKTPGSVSSLATIKEGTNMYSAEARLIEFLEEQNIEDPRIIDVGKLEWSGWEANKHQNIRKFHMQNGQSMHWKPEPETGTVQNGPVQQGSEMGFRARIGLIFKHLLDRTPWNIRLVLASAFLSAVSFTPYLYLINGNWKNPLAWLFPAFRSLGSFLCVVCIQLALQRRIIYIVMSRLLVMQYRRDSEDANDDFHNSLGLEEELYTCFSNAPKEPSSSSQTSPAPSRDSSSINLAHYFPDVEKQELHWGD